MRSLLVVQNEPNEDLGHFAPAFARLGVEARTVRAFAGEPVPTRVDADALVVMGGSPHVHDPASGPWMGDVMTLLRATHGRKPILGICLGAQLLAQALGGRARPGPAEEIGVGPVRLTPEGAKDPLVGGLGQTPAIHVHADTYDPPPGAVRLASTDAYPEQAFRVGAATYGLQFHLDLTPATLAANFGDDPGLERLLVDAKRHEAATAEGARKVAEAFVALKA